MNFPALDVALGLVFVYFLLAVVASAINEAVASAFRWRAQELERGLWMLLQNPEVATEGLESLRKLKNHPLIRPMLHPKNKATAAAEPPLVDGLPKTSRKTDLPSYIPSRTFATALLGLEQEAVSATQGVDLGQELRKVNESIGAIPSTEVRKALTGLLASAQGDVVRFRHGVEQWYDDHMERVSGWYRRRVQRLLWLLAFVIAFTINADTLQIAKRLWTDPATRTAVAAQAAKASRADASKALGTLPVPLGWHLASARHDPQGFPFYRKPSMAWALLSKLIGLTLTAIAITFGAPFWFDTLSKLARLRNSGAPPPASDAIRKGEGEEKRSGDRAPSPPPPPPPPAPG